MSRVYRNQQTGLVVATGKIQSISEDRMVMVVSSEEYNRGNNTNETVELKVSSGVPYDESYKPGFGVTAVGYPRGKGVIAAEGVFIGNDVLETQDLAIVTGLVKFARMNEEKNADGTPKMKQDGITPKKPHFDITVTVKEGDRYVDHVIKVYEFPAENGKKSNMERAANLFSKFDREENRIRATFVTAPGQSYSYTVNKDGMEYVNYGCSHMGYKSMDVEFIDQKEKTQGTPAKESKPAATAAKSPVEEPQHQNGGAGFESSLNMDEDELFK